MDNGLTLLLVHLIAMAVALGGSVFMVFVLSPVAARILPEPERMKLLSAILRRFHPLVLGCYGVLIMTGAWMITQTKIAAGVNYFHLYGDLLMLKLGIVFVALMVASFQFFGLGIPIVAIIEQGLDRSELPRKFRLLRQAALVNLGLVLVITYLGLKLGRG